MKKLSALAFALLLGIGLYGCTGTTPSDEDAMMELDAEVEASIE